MPEHKTATRDAWLEQRLDLLAAEKDLTRRSDEVTRLRERLPWVRVDKLYRFETEAGNHTLLDLFRGRSQLMIYHFMFGPDYEAGCPSCSAIADGFDGNIVHLENHDVAFSAVSRAPLAKVQTFRQRMGWTFPWASSQSSDFNYDFNVSITEHQQREGDHEYNYGKSIHAMEAKTLPPVVTEVAAQAGVEPVAYVRERPGLSTFVLEDGVVYHAYSTYARGLDSLWGMYQWLDRAPKGRNEKGVWWRHHDRYGRD